MSDLVSHVGVQQVTSVRLGEEWHHIVPGSLQLEDDDDTGDYWFVAQAVFEDTSEMIAGPWESVTAVSYPVPSATVGE